MDEHCEICGAALGESDSFVWHYPSEDCRALHKPIKESSMEKIKEAIVKVVTEKQGCKATELACESIIAILSRDVDVFEVVNELVQEGRLVEVEYTLPSMSYRTKSFLLPGGTEVTHTRK